MYTFSHYVYTFVPFPPPPPPIPDVPWFWIINPFNSVGYLQSFRRKFDYKSLYKVV